MYPRGESDSVWRFIEASKGQVVSELSSGAKLPLAGEDILQDCLYG